MLTEAVSRVETLLELFLFDHDIQKCSSTDILWQFLDALGKMFPLSMMFSRSKNLAKIVFLF